MVQALTTKDFDYVLHSDRDRSEEERTVFYLRRLSAVDSWRLQDDLGTIGQAGTVTPQVGKMNETALKAGLKGWSNFKDEEGNDVAFQRDAKERILGKERKVPGPYTSPAGVKFDSLLDLLSEDDRNELSDAIRTGSVLSVGEAGN